MGRFALCAALAIAALPAVQAQAAKPRMSHSVRADIPGKRLFDIGVADPDHDGMNNFAEWIAGTNPTNAASNLRLTLVSATNASHIVVSWPSVAGTTYWLERSTNLTTGFNSIVATNITATVPTNTQTDTAILPGSTRLYRVGVEQ